MRLYIDDEEMSSDVLGALKQTSKGQLIYDTKWREEGRTAEIVDSVKQSVSSINLAPRSALRLLREREQTTSPRENGTFSDGRNTSATSDTSSMEVAKRPKSPTSSKETSLKSTKTINRPYRSSSPTEQSRAALEKMSLYEYERFNRVQSESEDYAQEILETRAALKKNIEKEIEQINKKYHLRKIEKQKQYEEDCAKLMKDVELQLKEAEASNSTSTKDYSVKLKEIQERVRLHKKQEEEKRQQQQAEFKQSLVKNKDSINNVIQEFGLITRQIQPPLPSNVLDELAPLLDVLQQLAKELDSFLTSSDITGEQVQAGITRQQTALEIRQKFIEIIQNHILRPQVAVPPPPPVTVVTTTNSIPIAQRASEPNKMPQAPVTKPPSEPQVNDRPAQVTDEFTLDAKSIYLQSQMELVSIEERCKMFTDNKANNRLRTALQLSVRTPINQLCNQPLRELKSKTLKLLDLFSGKPGNQNARCSERDNSLYFVLNDAAKSFLSVSFKQKNMAIKLAPVIAYLWAKVPSFGKIFLAQLFRNCPYAVPYYPVKSSNQDETEYMVTCGYQLNSEGQISETEEIYLERMYAMIQLYAAIIQCNMSQGHPRDLQYGWNWLGRVLSDTPKPRITAIMLDAFLSVSTHKLLRCYGEQFKKMFQYIANTYIPKINALTPKAERQTLMKFQSMLENIQRKIDRSRDPSRELAIELNLVPDHFFT